jgi:hypothetical protein
MFQFEHSTIDPRGLPGVESASGFWINGKESPTLTTHRDTETIIRRAIERCFDARSVVIRHCHVSFTQGHLVISGEIEPPVQPSGARHSA